MRFIVLSSELYAYLQVLNKVIPTRSIVPLVENFLFEITSEGLKITATDLETTMMSFIELENVDGEGTVAIGAKRLMEILKEFAQQPLTFEINEETYEVVIKSETGKYSIPGYSSVEEYPKPPEISADNANSFIINSELLNKAINYTLYTVGEDELRPILNGILFELKPDYATFVATDSHKLVKYRRKDIKSENEASFVLAKKPAELLKNILPKLEEDVKIEFDDKNAVFEMPNFKLVCRLIEGVYPDYEAVMPKQNDKVVEINRNSLLFTTRRVSLFSNEASKLVKYFFHDNQAEITAQDIDFSISAYEQIACKYDGEAIAIGFKSTFMHDILQNYSCEDVAISMLQKKTPALIYPTFIEDENEELVTMLMPITIDED